ncbi:hypothetical protein [Thermocatellispora tengchongensis]|uniref:hypothetical protein n=1 Tax=Thermocatellispora tengchongensis TaxID=1073253 RepID=UPI0031E73B9B
MARRSVRDDRALARPYRDLVWLAYLVLPPREHDPERRLVTAHRLAARALARAARAGDDFYPLARRRVLRAALRRDRLHALAPGGRRRPWRTSWWRAGLEIVPATVRGEDVGFTAELDRLPAAARAAYALTRLEGLRPEELAAAGLAHPARALAAVAGLEARHGAAGRLCRPSADPTLARVYARLPGSRARPVMVAVTVAAVLAATIPIWLGLSGGGHTPARGAAPAGHPGSGGPGVALVPAGAWRATPDPGPESWEPRGDLRAARGLLGRALAAWGAPARTPPQLLYAGTVGGGRVVLLRVPGRVARYTEPVAPAAPATPIPSVASAAPTPSASALDGATGDGTAARRPAVAVFAEPRGARRGAAGPLEVAPGRYLLPPWVTEVAVAPLAGAEPRWRALGVRDGVTDPVPAEVVAAGRERCGGRGPVFRLRAPAVAGGAPYTMIDLGGAGMAAIRYEPPPPAEAGAPGPYELSAAPAGFGAWTRAGCPVRWPAGEVRSATAWEFWAGRLPERARGRWICLRFTGADGGSVTRGVLLVTARGRTRAITTGQRRDTWDCSRLGRDIVSGTWWRAPSRRWYYLAAGSRQVTGITVGRHDGDGAFLAVRGPRRGPEPSRTPRLSARTLQGAATPVFQAP